MNRWPGKRRDACAQPCLLHAVSQAAFTGHPTRLLEVACRQSLPESSDPAVDASLSAWARERRPPPQQQSLLQRRSLQRAQANTPNMRVTTRAATPQTLVTARVGQGGRDRRRVSGQNRARRGAAAVGGRLDGVYSGACRTLHAPRYTPRSTQGRTGRPRAKRIKGATLAAPAAAAHASNAPMWFSGAAEEGSMPRRAAEEQAALPCRP